MTTKAQAVSDEVWSQLDPKAGALSRGQSRRIAAVTALVAVVGAATAALWISGVVRANLDWSYAAGSGGQANPTAHTFSTDVVIKNDGWTAVHVTGVGADTAGLHFTGTGKPNILTDRGRTVPFTLQPGQVAVVAVTYQVTDCKAVTSDSYDVPVRVDRFWGTETVGISLPSQFETDRPDVPWQRAYADQACGMSKP